MDKLFLDCNILLDWLTNRPPFSLHAERLLSLIETRQVSGFVSPLVLANTYYILRKQTSKKIANEFLNDSKILFEIIALDKEATLQAIEQKYKDFEDDLHYYSALASKVDYIITRNKADFLHGKIKINTAEEYLRMR